MAATDNVALLAFSISKKLVKSKALKEKQQELGTAADMIPNLLNVCSACIKAWIILLQRQMWLHLALSIVSEMRKELCWTFP